MNKYFTTLFSIISCSLLLFFLPMPLFAQMFSIDDPEPRRERPLGMQTVAGLGWELGDYSYAGEGAPENQRLDFTDSILKIFLESPGLDVSLAFGGSFTGMDDNSYLNVSGRIYNNFPLIRNRNTSIAIPIQLTTDIKQVRRNDNDSEFQQSSLIFGTGLFSAFRLSERFSIQAKATPNYGFSFSQGSLFGGNLFRFDGRSSLNINNVFGSRSLSVGYRFDYRVYRIEGNLNDYDYLSHTFTIGLGF